MKRIIIILFVSGLTGLPLTRCASTVGAGQIRAEKVTGGVERALKLINDSDLSPAIKRAVAAELTPIIPEVKKMGTDLDKKDAEIDSLKWYKNIFWQAVMVIGGIAIGAFLYWKFK